MEIPNECSICPNEHECTFKSQTMRGHCWIRPKINFSDTVGHTKSPLIIPESHNAWIRHLKTRYLATRLEEQLLSQTVSQLTLETDFLPIYHSCVPTPKEGQQVLERKDRILKSFVESHHN